MKTAIALLVLGLAVPVFAESADETALYEAVFDVAGGLPDVTNSESWTDEGRSFDASALAIPDSPVFGNDDVLEDFLRAWYGTRLADELLASYRQNANLSGRLPSLESARVRVLELDAFRLPGHRYDWERLATAYPDVRAVVEASRPALDSSSTYMVVRYEVITPKGSVWSSFHEFEKQPDGNWIERRAIGGDITKRDPKMLQP
jgi:hypothetical protein